MGTDIKWSWHADVGVGVVVPMPPWRAVAVSTGAVDIDAVRPAIDAAGRGLLFTSFSAYERTLVRSEKPRFGGELHALHGRAHAAQLVQEHFEHCMGYVELNNEGQSSRNGSDDARRA